MHELGIIVHVAQTVEEVAQENEVTDIASVTLEIGEVSGIVHDYLSDGWLYYRKKRPLLQNCELKMVPIPALTYCQICQETYPTVQYGRQCPHCQSWSTYLLKGDECLIKEIEAM